MAFIDDYNRKEIVNYFNQLGFPVQSINTREDTYTTIDGINYIKTPIRLVSSFNGDTYNVYYTRSRAFRITDNVKKDIDNKLIINLFADNPQDYVKVEKTSSGNVFFNTDELSKLSEEDYAESINEFTNLQDFNSIDAPDYSLIYAENPQVSSATPTINIDEITNIQYEESKKLLEEQEKIWVKTKKDNDNGILDTAFWTFEEVDKLYNSKCTIDDKRAFFIYLQNKCGKQLKGDFSKFYGSPYPAEALTLLELLKKGRLFYDPTAERGERLQPRVIYRSGNIWKKYASLTNKKDEYIKRFGEEIYNLHLNEINDIYQLVWQNRLRVSGSDSQMLIKILPISQIAEEFRINEIISPTNREKILKNFQVYTSFIDGKLVEDIANISGGKADLNKISKVSLTLKEAFIKWCTESGGGVEALNYGIQWSSETPSIEKLIDRYLKPIQNPFSSEKNGKDKWARVKDDAMKVGDRLFAQFLKDGLIASDQTKLEIVWNQIYNSYQEPNLDEVPIGFTYKKYLDGKDLFTLKKSTLNAIRYYLTRGTIGLAYGVGIGKTFCSIFVMKQALDLGIAERPLVIVPNAVYFQFAEEIKRGLGEEFNFAIPNSRCQGFYNGGEIFNTLGNNAVNGINICTYEATEKMVFNRDKRDEAWISNSINVLEMGMDVSSPLQQAEFKKEHNSVLFGDLFIDEDENNTDLITDVDIDTMIESDTTFDSTDEDEDLGDFKNGGGISFKEKTKKEPKQKVVLDPIYLNIESTNYDFVCIDEAHNFNNLFTSVIASPKDIQTDKKGVVSLKVKRENNPYSKIKETSSGKESSLKAEKLFWIARFVQTYNRFGNTCLLSATPFTNSPLQVYTMMTILDYDILYKMQLGIIKDFFDIFAKIEYSEDFTTDLKIVKRNKFIGWSNAIALQKLVYRYFDKSTREEEDNAVIRPQKLNLPLKRLLVNGKVFELSKDNFISTTIKMSELQIKLWNNVRKYCDDQLRYEDICNDETQNTTKFGKYVAPIKKEVVEKDNTDDDETDVENPDDLADGTKEGEKAKKMSKRLQCLGWGRQIAYNPYLFKCSGFKENPTAKQYVEASPKLLYVMKCIESIKKYTEKNNPSVFIPKENRYVGGMSGQIIYMNFGKDGFPLIQDYLVQELKFDINEIGIIAGGGSFIGKKKQESKQLVADAFIGRFVNTQTNQITYLSDEKRVKVLIGSSSIAEGINLQNFTSVLYNCFLDFNPTQRIQVEGRLWRQGNQFANVRIVTPLMADCIDIFMFQKLEDKTQRINQLWTKNGQLNDLDTTAFDPQELKFELLTDPMSIAVLEIENKIEQLERQKEDLSRGLSDYLQMQSEFTKGEEALYPPIQSVKQDFRARVYSCISQIRPDLIDKPLLNKQNFAEYIKNYNESASSKGYPTLNDYSNFYMLAQNFNFIEYTNPFYFERYTYYKNPKQLNIVNSFFNYSAKELILLMVQVIKEEKIGYPRGYSKNWREVYAKKVVMPILDGDIVEYDTKKGRKKGVADLVLDAYEKSVLYNFYEMLYNIYQNANSTNDENLKQLEDAQKSLRKKVNFNEKIVSLEDLDPPYDDLKFDLKLLFRWYLENTIDIISYVDSNTKKIELKIDFKPIYLDIVDTDIEEMNIEDKNVSKIKNKEDENKEVKPTKYPEPITYSNTKIQEALLDIQKYIDDVEVPKVREYTQGESDYNFKNLQSSVLPFFTNNFELEVNNQYIFPTDGRFQSIIGILGLTNSYNLIDYPTKFIFTPNWIDLLNKWSANSYYGLFVETYFIFLPRYIADLDRLIEKKFKILGITSGVDIDLLISKQKEDIQGIQVQQTAFNDPQVIEEVVQEVMRKQEELNSEEIRAGSSYLARAILFEKCNPEYLGNELLSIFMNNPKKYNYQCGEVFTDAELVIDKTKIQKPIKAQIDVEDIEVVEELVENNLNQKQQTLVLISDLEEVLEYQSVKDKKITKLLITDLKEVLEFI